MPERTRSQRLQFLLGFLTDESIRDEKVHPERYEGPCAGFVFHELSVRNLAAMTVAGIVDLRTRVEPDWTETQWSALRSRIVEEVRP
jgi:hypothetical protein